MKITLKLEEGFKFIFSYWLSLQLGFQWWVFLAWLLVPDLSMIGYAINTRIGAILYNLFHHQGFAILIGLVGVQLKDPTLQFAGVLLFGHSAMDRMFGYGLKYSDDFKHTHLGWIGKSANQ